MVRRIMLGEWALDAQVSKLPRRSSVFGFLLRNPPPVLPKMCFWNAFPFIVEPLSDSQCSSMFFKTVTDVCESIQGMGLQGTNSLDTETTNRASVVTMFQRTDITGKYDAKFQMLFTGDAYDQPCDIRDTIQAWNIGQGPLTFQVDVLKVSAHFATLKNLVVV